MREPAVSLFGASARGSGEDRVTEVFATVLERVKPLADVLAQRLALERADSYEIRTQVRVDGAGIIDLQIQGRDATNNPIWLLWSEHKTDSTFGERQLAKYRTAIAESDLPTCLAVILLRSPSPTERASIQEAEAELLTWNDIVVLTHRAGTALGGDNWRTITDSDVEHLDGRRTLIEWSDFCAHELGEHMAAPLPPTAAAAIGPAYELFDTLDDLVAHAMQSACTTLGATAVKPLYDDDGYRASAPSNTWAARQKLSLYTAIGVGDEGTEPAFKVGAWWEGSEAAQAQQDSSLTDRLKAASYLVSSGGKGRHAWFDFRKELSIDLVAAEDGLEAQRQKLDDFATPCLREIVDGVGLAAS